MKLIKSIFIILLFCISSNAIAQEETNTYTIGTNGAYGFIIPHNPGMLYITAQHIQKQEVFFEKHTFGEKSWHQRYGFPSMGLSLAHFYLNNPRHLGNATSLSPYLSFQLNNNVWKLKLRTALGIGYFSKRFHADENYKNNAIGSYLNLFFSVAFRTEVRLLPRLDFVLGANFSHFSNTGFSKPNLGINLPLIETGFNYHFGERQTAKAIEEATYQREKAFWSLSAGAGINAVYPPDGVKYLASNLSFEREKRINYKSSIGAAVDFYYNPAQRVALKRKDIVVDKGWDNLQYGLSLYHLLHFGKFGVITKAGYYLQTENEELGNFYHMVGGKIAINNGLNGFFALKTHFAKAEYFMIGLNYQFKQ